MLYGLEICAVKSVHISRRNHTRFDLKSLLESWINIEYKLCADQGGGSGAPPLKGKTY